MKQRPKKHHARVTAERNRKLTTSPRRGQTGPSVAAHQRRPYIPRPPVTTAAYAAHTGHPRPPQTGLPATSVLHTLRASYTPLLGPERTNALGARTSVPRVGVLPTSAQSLPLALGLTSRLSVVTSAVGTCLGPDLR